MKKLPLNEERFNYLLSLLQAHDYNFMYSDDKKAYTAGKRNKERIITECNNTIEEKFTVMNLEKYCPSGAYFFTRRIERIL